MQKEFTIRAVQLEDVAVLCDLLNAIIAKGGTTSRRAPLSVEKFTEAFLSGADFISCLVVEAQNSELLGFQALEHRPFIPDDWGDIATFTKIGNTAKGVGTALFESTLKLAQDKGLVAINATIRSYNTDGLKYYSKMGFIEYKREPAEPLTEGVPAEMIFHKRTV